MSVEITLPANNWEPRHYQAGFWDYMQRTPWGARAILCHHRRAGKDHTAINWAATASQQRVGTYIHVFPYNNQGRRIIWEGIDRNGVKFLDAFPQELVVGKSDLEMRLKLANGSVYQVLGADDPDKLVGINCIGAIFSEYALMNPKALDLIMPILNENGGWAIFPTTPRGKNHFHKLIENARKDPKWYVSVETIDTTGAVDPSVVEEERRRGVEEPLIQQEYYCSFDAGLQGAYYERQIAALEAEGLITAVPFEPALEVHTAWDIGLNDTNVLWFFQLASDSIRIIDFYEASDRPFSHYAQILRERADCRDYVFGRHFGPHDINHRSIQTGKSLAQVARELGVRFTCVSKIPDIIHGIEAVRQTLPKCRFDEAKCYEGVNHLKSYRKQWDDKNKCYRDRPLHDIHSNAADAFRTLAMGLQEFNLNRKRPSLDPKNQNAQSEYDPFSR